MANLPKEYLDNVKQLFREDFEEYLNCFEKERYYGLRINTDKNDKDRFERICPFGLKKIPWTSDGYYINASDLASKHLLYNAGAYYLQEPSAMLPAESLPVNEGDIVFDCCAAPGGKSDELLNKLKGTGVLISNDISASRSKALLRNLEKHGSDRFLVISEDITKMDDRFINVFDKILVDAPCSGEGMFRKDKDLIKSWSPSSNDDYSKLQKEIVKRVVSFLKPGGMMVYSTCTFSKKENEEVVQFILDEFPEMSVEPLPLHDDFVEGDIPGTRRLYPHKIQGEGHFVALLRKNSDDHQNDNYLNNKHNKKHNNENKGFKVDFGKALECVNEFFEHVKKDYYDACFEIHGESLYLTPILPFDMKGVRVLRSGLLLGDLKKGRFEPSQALAVSLRSNEFDQVIELDEEDSERYLKGETLMCEPKLKGYVLVCYKGLPLGFGKANGGVLNNKIDKGWRKL